MKTIIVGAGFTGTQLAHHLVLEGHDVSLIESNEERARYASNRLDSLVLHGEGNSVEALEEVGIANADALVCVTESDEVNMIICGLAASLYEEERHDHKHAGGKKLIKIARVRNTDYKKLNRTHSETDGKHTSRLRDRKALGIDHFIHPDIEAANAVIIAMSHGASGNIFNFPGTPYELGSVNIKEKSAFDGLALVNFRSVAKEEGVVTLVERGADCFLPEGSTVLREGDLLHVVTHKEHIEGVFSLAGRDDAALKRVGIVGAGHLGSLVAEQLLADRKYKVTIIEQDYELCEELAARFPRALVLNEDISDENFVAEERMGELDLIITATENQEQNIVAALYLKSRGVRRAIALVSSSGYKTIALQLGVDVAIPVNSVVIDSIFSLLTGGSIRGIHSIGDGSVGIIEVEIGKDSHAADKAITEFRLSAGGVIMLVKRGGESFIPHGDYVFKPEDKIIIIAKDGSSAEIQKFFTSPKKGFWGK